MALRTGVILATLLSAGALADPQPGHFVCDAGPVQKHIGQSDWSVYSCHDGVTLLFSGNGIYFEISALPDGIERGGESTAGKDKIEAAIAELKTMKHDALTALIAQTEGKK